MYEKTYFEQKKGSVGGLQVREYVPNTVWINPRPSRTNINLKINPNRQKSTQIDEHHEIVEKIKFNAPA